MDGLAPKLREHLPELDGVRGLAIAGVMALHFSRQIRGTSTLELAFVKISGYGLWGVDLFFVLSGFLITGILLDTKEHPRYFQNFYIRRLLRIFPLYYLVLFLVFIVVTSGVGVRFDPALSQTGAQQGWVWLYVTNYYLGGCETWSSLPYLSHFWSLAIEEHFYLLWPVVIMLLRREFALKVCMMISLAALALRIAFSILAPNLLYAGVLTPCRLDSLCVGAAFAIAARQPIPLRASTAIRWLILAFSSVAAVSLWHLADQSADAVIVPVRTTLLAIVFGCFIYAVVASDRLGAVGGLLRMSSLRRLGKYSYGLYVFHGIVSYAIHQHVPEAGLTNRLGSHAAAGWLLMAAGFGLSYGLAVISYEFWEERFLSLKDRWAPRDAGITPFPKRASKRCPISDSLVIALSAAPTSTKHCNNCNS